MCLMLYMAADSAVPLIPWDESGPAFHVSVPSSSSATDVRARFSKPHLVYLGSHDGCGCGFQHSEPGQVLDSDPDPVEVAQSAESMRRLANYVAEAVKRVGPVELYMCWDAEQGLEALGTETTSCVQLHTPGYALPCRTLLQVNT